MIERPYEELAAEFCAAIKKMADREDVLENFESYLSIHFAWWFEHFITSPKGLVSEVRMFASISDA